MGASVRAVSLKGSAVPMPMLNVSRPAIVSCARVRDAHCMMHDDVRCQAQLLP